jgi:hypothetical protein
MLKMQNLTLLENKELWRISELGKPCGRYRSPGDGQVDFKTISVNYLNTTLKDGQ